MSGNRSCLAIGSLVLALLQPSAHGMGLRSFVALPVEIGGSVLRGIISHNTNTESNSFVLNAAYGVGQQQTLLLGIPYRLSPRGDNRMGDISVLYRHTVMQVDTPQGTDRLGLLGGVIVPTDDERDGALQAGMVFTHFRGRNEFDLDVLFQQGLGNHDNAAQYDLSWQYRFSPFEYPEWGIPHEWYIATELGGRWTQGGNMVHQLTLGLQWVVKRWVIEGGVIQDINSTKQTQFILSIRFH